MADWLLPEPIMASQTCMMRNTPFKWFAKEKYAHIDFYNRNQKDGYKLKGNYTEEHVISILRRSYEEDYFRWKNAFGLSVAEEFLLNKRSFCIVERKEVLSCS